MNSKAIFQKNQKAILQVVLFVEGENSQNKISIRGTGFIVAEDGKFITCAHVYNEVPENEREFLGVMIMENITAEGLSNYQFSKASLISKDEENDVALLKIDSETQKKFDVIEKLKSDAVVQEGDEVIFLGFPLALELLQMGFGVTLALNKCVISSVKRRGVDSSLHFFLVDTHINNGSSGSPLFNEFGEIVGIASGKITHAVLIPNMPPVHIPANMGVCRPIQYAINIIEKA